MVSWIPIPQYTTMVSIASCSTRRPPGAYRPRVLGVMTVRVEPQATTKPRVARQLLLGSTLYERDQAAVYLVLLREYLGQRPWLPLLGHLGVEGIDAAMGHRIARRPPAGEHERQVRERFFFPPGDVRDDVPDRPGPGDPWLHQLRIRQAGIGLLKVHPCLLEALHQLLPTHAGSLRPVGLNPLARSRSGLMQRRARVFEQACGFDGCAVGVRHGVVPRVHPQRGHAGGPRSRRLDHPGQALGHLCGSLGGGPGREHGDRKSTRLNSSHVEISYAVFCLKKKKKKKNKKKYKKKNKKNIKQN